MCIHICVPLSLWIWKYTIIRPNYSSSYVIQNNNLYLPVCQLIRQRLKELLNSYIKKVLHYIFLHITLRSITNMHIYKLYSIWIVTTGKNEITWKVNYKIKSNALKGCYGVHCALIQKSIHLDAPFSFNRHFSSNLHWHKSLQSSDQQKPPVPSAVKPRCGPRKHNKSRVNLAAQT